MCCGFEYGLNSLTSINSCSTTNKWRRSMFIFLKTRQVLCNRYKWAELPHKLKLPRSLKYCNEELKKNFPLLGRKKN
jgi:hypothetical protein